jgi:hypothetical protein
VLPWRTPSHVFSGVDESCLLASVTGFSGYPVCCLWYEALLLVAWSPRGVRPWRNELRRPAQGRPNGIEECSSA